MPGSCRVLILFLSTRSARTRSDRRHVDRAEAPPALATPSRSCRAACRCARPRARREHRMVSGSSPHQTIKDAAKEVAIDVRGHADTVHTGDFDLDPAVGHCRRQWRANRFALCANRNRHQLRPGRRRYDSFGRWAIPSTPDEHLVRIDIVLPGDDRDRHARRQCRRDDFPLQRLRPALVPSPLPICVHAICVHDWICGHIHIPGCLRSAQRLSNQP